MRIMILTVAAAGVALLAGCGENRVEDEVTRAYDRQASSIEQRADQLEAQAEKLKTQADTLESQASDLDDRAKQIRETGYDLSQQVRDGVITQRQAMPRGAPSANPARADGAAQNQAAQTEPAQ